MTGPGDCRRSRPGAPHGGSAMGLCPGLVEAHDSDIPFWPGGSGLKIFSDSVA
jgi:hypothetical protein